MMTNKELIEFCLFTILKDIRDKKNTTTYVGVLSRENMSTPINNLQQNFQKVFPLLSFEEFICWGRSQGYVQTYHNTKGEYCYFSILANNGFKVATVNNIPYGNICWGGLGLGGIIQDPAVNSVVLIPEDNSTLVEYQSQFPERKDKRRDVMVYIDNAFVVLNCVLDQRQDLSLRQRYEYFLGIVS